MENFQTWVYVYIYVFNQLLMCLVGWDLGVAPTRRGKWKALRKSLLGWTRGRRKLCPKPFFLLKNQLQNANPNISWLNFDNRLLANLYSVLLIDSFKIGQGRHFPNWLCLKFFFFLRCTKFTFMNVNITAMRRVLANAKIGW